MSSVRRPRVSRSVAEEPVQEALPFFSEADQPLLATNTGVRLACTLAAMLSPFALFLCGAEKDKTVIRRFAVQSTALLILHLLGGAFLGVTSLIVGSVPYLGFLMTLLGWLIYIAIAVVVLILRIKLMERAWHGRRFDLPLLERLTRHYY